MIVPQMTYSDNNVRARYDGNLKISAIKTVRSVFGLDLRAAKDLVEWPGGFTIHRNVFDTLNSIFRDNAKMYDGDYVIGAFVIMEEFPEPINMTRG